MKGVALIVKHSPQPESIQGCNDDTRGSGNERITAYAWNKAEQHSADDRNSWNKAAARTADGSSASLA